MDDDLGTGRGNVKRDVERLEALGFQHKQGVADAHELASDAVAGEHTRPLVRVTDALPVFHEVRNQTVVRALRPLVAQAAVVGELQAPLGPRPYLLLRQADQVRRVCNRAAADHVLIGEPSGAGADLRRA